MRRWLVLVVLVVVMAGGACVPLKVSKECKEHINECLKSCQSVYVPTFPGPGTNDNRNACQQRCHQLCK